jgi:hypothetical protein
MPPATIGAALAEPAPQPETARIPMLVVTARLITPTIARSSVGI